ncbi:thyroglobulin [Discoglossus pictus]
MILLLVGTLLCTWTLTLASPSEYQVDSEPLRPCELARGRALTSGGSYIPQCSKDGLYRNTQCVKNGSTCWCVDTDGTEVPGSRRTNSLAVCLSFCQLKKQQILLSGYINSTSTSYVPQCKDSGEFEDVQCDQKLGQCWCVDSEGMEIYGTRQTGRPAKCPQSCEIRDRRILHGVGEKVPPHCSADGEFSPVQCKLLNTTDNMALDIVTSFSRFPDAFKSFSSLRESFPEISGYCYCADSLGRELADTGLELLLGEVYDTVFSGLSPSKKFTETAIYRILQRRFLGVQLITSGKFRCPSSCEIQQYTALQTGDIYTPTCDDNGDFDPVQCQAGGQCWCVDSKGREIYGTRTNGKIPNCNHDQDCPFKRRQALSHLFYGPSEHGLSVTQEEEQGSKISTKYCGSYITDIFVKSGLLVPITEKSKDNQVQLNNFISDMITGLFPSKDLIQVALRFTSNPKRFQQNLFGGKFLKNMGTFNFTGAVGPTSKFSFSKFFQQIGLTGMYSGGNFKELAKLFSSEEDSYLTKDSLNLSRPIFNLNQPIQSSFGRIVNLRKNQNIVSMFSSILELKEFSMFLRDVISIPPNVAQDVTEAVKIIMQSRDCAEKSLETYVPTCTKDGRYQEIQCSKYECWCVDDQGREVERSRTQGKHPRCPTKCEKERDRQKDLKASVAAGSEVFIPVCDQKGDFMTVQCAGKYCFCVDLEGRTIPGTRKISGDSIECPNYCQLSASQAFLQTTRMLLSDVGAISQISSVYIPQCSDSGIWRPVQCSGPTEQGFELYQKWIMLNKDITFSDTMNVILEYKNTSSQSFYSFVKELYNNGHQSIFPIFSKYSFFNDVPKDVLDGNITILSDNILLNPYVFWRLLNDSISYYPGSYSDFNTPLAHFELRNCWCVDENGQKLEGTETAPNKIPKCPVNCELAKQRTLQFIDEANELIATSNSSHFPFGHSFLMASGIRLTQSDFFHSDDLFKSGISFSERFLSRDNYALQLAATSTLHFYWRGRFAAKSSFGQTTQLSYLPYIPQCDGFGNWEPVQYYQSTGHYWCVDENGNYIADSLVSRTSQPPQCQTSCQRSQTTALISRWTPRSPNTIPSCTETGQYSTFQKSEANFWCVSPRTGNVILQGLNIQNNSTVCPSECTMLKSEVNARAVGTGYIPTCGEDGAFSPVQCDQDRGACYCVFSNGEEAAGIISGRAQMSCKSPVCPFSFGANEIKHGALFCENEAGEMFQKCQLICRKGYWNAFSSEAFVCDVKTQQWVSRSPHLLSCQRPQAFQIVQAQAHIQLLLPSSKTCMADYSASLQAFKTFVLDDLKARGLCHIQVSSFGSRSSSAVPVCDESTVYVECLSEERLGVNITWRAQLEDIPQTALPDLHDVENAIVGENLIGRFLSVVRAGDYNLNLDSKQFVADESVFFPQDEEFSVSPQAGLGCKQGFQKQFNSNSDSRKLGGCVICPEGSYSQNEACTRCPTGLYQDKAGSTKCMKCPLDTTTAYTGAYNISQCLTNCQMNRLGLLCDDEGRYIPSQKNLTDNKSYCVDFAGEKMKWTEVDTNLTNDECLWLRKFELVSEDKLVFTAEDSGIIQSKQTNGQKKQFLECIVDCAMQELCDYLTVLTSGNEVICDQYNDDSNINCTTTEQTIGVFGNSASFSVEQLSCKLKIKQSNINNLSVFRKKGQEFPRTGLTIFERTDFKNAVSGVYSTIVFSAESTTLTDAHSFCRQTCGQDSCCNGFILNNIILNKGTIQCGLLSSPDVLLCNINDWSETSRLSSDGVCKGVKSNEKQKMFSFFLGGQEFTGSYSMLSQSIGKVEYSTELSAEVKEEIQQRFTSFQRVFLRKDKMTLPSGSVCSPGAQHNASVSDSAKDLFLPVEGKSVVTIQEIKVSNQQFVISKERYSSEQAVLWCLTRCAEEESWCRLADLQDTTKDYFTCIIYPDTWKCNNTSGLIPDDCVIALNSKPQIIYRKKEILGDRVKSFYIPLPYKKLTGISVRRKISQTGRSVSNGFFNCELQCDSDPCCKGFGYMQSSSIEGNDLWCLTLGSLGIQSCGDEARDPWHVIDCGTLDPGMGTHPFGWYQKPESKKTFTSSLCPSLAPPHAPQEEYLGDWQVLNRYSVITDPSMSTYDEVRISGDSPNSFNTAQNYCLSVCSRVQSCVLTTIEVQQLDIRCLFYPETQSCSYNVDGHDCKVLVKEQATYIFRKKASTVPVTSVMIPSLGTLSGKSQTIQIGSSMKYVNHFLGIPYAAPPVGEKRFLPPQPFTWTGTWNATTSRASCLQPGDGKAQYSSVGEDCLYLNVFVPQNIGLNSAVLLYFHNSPSDYSVNGQTFLDGSYQAAIGNIIVVTASYRVGVFGFLHTGTTVPSGNWGLLDQAAALKWIQENIAYFGGDAGLVSIAADRSGADIASIHLLLPGTQLFRRALLMGGSAFSPALVISERRAQEQVNFLAKEVGCSPSGSGDLLTCLRNIDADVLNAAQTKLLAVRGPFQTWGAVVDNVYVRDSPSRLLDQKTSQKIDLLIGSAEQDGLISRAKAIKRFEEAQGRGESKTAFYQALQNSLGGTEVNSQVQEAAVWFYSLEHSTDDYSGFSRGLENSTRDHFIACPTVRMAKHWAENSNSNVYMYYVPETFSQSSSGLDLPEDVVYVFGLPFHSNYKKQFSTEKQNLSLKIMQYVSNFVKTGNPNFSYAFSRKISSSLPAWPMYLSHNNGENYKEFSNSLINNKALKKAECSFWNDYIPALKASTNINNIPENVKANGPLSTTTPARLKEDKESYN